MVCRLDDPVEGVSGRHVLEGGSGGHVYGPALGQHYYLGELSPGGVVEGAEGAVPVARYDPVAIEIAHRLVEVVGRQHVAEADRTCGRDSGGRNGGPDGGVGAGGCVGGRGRGGRGCLIGSARNRDRTIPCSRRGRTSAIDWGPSSGRATR